MRIAVVHDYFIQSGGAEKVAEEIFLMLPQPSLFSTVAVKASMPPGLRSIPVHTSFMQHLPMIQKYHRLYFMLYPVAVRSLDVSKYDLVISSSSGYAKGVLTDPHAIHVCYCHTPMRWAWRMDEYLAGEKVSPVIRALLPPLQDYLRKSDSRAARQPDYFVANSRAVAARIESCYGRTAEVIYPPIDVNRFRLVDEQGDYYITLSRFVQYKRLDLAIKACTQLKRKLLVIGGGPNRDTLMMGAGPTVTFMGILPDAQVEFLVSRCRALIFPGEEDFGMAPLEVAAAGRPSIAYRAGGAVETILDGVTGIFFERQEVEDLCLAIELFEKQHWVPLVLRRHAEGFGIDVFRQRFRAYLRGIGAPVDEETSILPEFKPVSLREPVEVSVAALQEHAR